jgi:large subunit ribosomal protein L11
MKVPVKVVIDTTNKTFEIEVGTPPTSSLIMKELNLEKGSSSTRTEKVGDLTLDQVKKIVQMKGQSILGNSLKDSVKEILGTCVSMGITIDGQDPRDVQRLIDEGKYKVE